MRVYVLESETLGTKVYSSYSAMLSHLKQECGDYEEAQYNNQERGRITFIDDTNYEHVMYYEALDIIGEHSAKTDMLVFKSLWNNVWNNS